MTRNLFVLFYSGDDARFAELFYANGKTVHASDLIGDVKKLSELKQLLLDCGYTNVGMSCNPEVLDYVVIVTEWNNLRGEYGLLLREFNAWFLTYVQPDGNLQTN